MSISEQVKGRSIRDLSMEDMWHFSHETTAGHAVIKVQNDRSHHGS